eukprot:TRINITY_DN10947_c0_g1_i2.p1 TRINITY_DN10947_c0_g1~~TRINITY_DN10947_c0_g1_i2.p1  ORF type:complete len:110 (+),score=15.47 TRINITY_DN10947_c0_g1_i2:429-758(+)
MYRIEHAEHHIVPPIDSVLERQRFLFFIFLSVRDAMWLSINRLPIITTVFLRINSHDDIDGIDDPRHVTQNSQQQTDAELQTAATMPQKNPQRRKQDCNQDLEADGTPL